MYYKSEDYKKLFIALKNHQYNEAEAILSQDKENIYKNSRGENLLWRAIELNNIEMFEWLLNKGFSIDDLNTMNESLILHAVVHSNLSFLNTILSISTKNIDVISSKGFSPLMLACLENKKETVESLIKHGCNLNIQNQYLNTALIIAISKSDYEIVKLLIDNNADINIANSDGDTPLIISAKYKKLDSLIYLLENSSSFDINKKNKYGSTVTSFILNSQFFNDVPQIIIDLLIKKEANFNVNIFGERASSPFLESIKIGDINTFLKLINTENINVNITDSEGNDIVHYLCLYNYLTPYLIKRIVECGYDVKNVKSKNGFTPYFALLKNECSYEELEYMVKLLKEYGFKNAYKTLADEDLLDACISNRNQKLLEILLNNNILDVKNNYKNGNSLIHKITEIIKNSEEIGLIYLKNELAYERENLLNSNDNEYIRDALEHIEEQEYEINKMKEDIKNILSYIINYSKIKQISINEVNDEGDTPLMLLISSGQSLILEYFLEYQPNILIENEYGENALCYAIKYGRLDVFNSLYNIINCSEKELSKILLNIIYNLPEDDIRKGITLASIEHVIDLIKPYINKQDENGNTPLIVSCALNESNMSILLLKYGADPSLTNTSNETALMHACANNNIEVVKKLLECGADVDVVNNKKKTASDLTYNIKIKEMLINKN